MILNAQIYKTNNIVNLAIIDIGTTMYKFLPSGVFTIEPYSSGSLRGQFGYRELLYGKPVF